jgi:hypothetical protein
VRIRHTIDLVLMERAAGLPSSRATTVAVDVDGADRVPVGELVEDRTHDPECADLVMAEVVEQTDEGGVDDLELGGGEVEAVDDVIGTEKLARLTDRLRR